MTSLRGLIVLLVDDDDDVRDVLSEILQRAGAVVAAAASARQALTLLDPVPDAIVVELLSREGDVTWLLDEVRARGLTMPVLAIAGHLDARSRVPMQQRGFADLLLKPVGADALTRAIALRLGRPAGHAERGQRGRTAPRASRRNTTARRPPRRTR
jgi:DNA-binding NtrC family response regulator